MYRFSKYIIAIGLFLTAFNPVVVFAQPTGTAALPVYNAGVDETIKEYLCTPSEPADGQDLTRCINRLFRFGITAGALVLVFFVVVAGYMYITGGETGKTKGKNMLMNSVTGMAILLGGYLLLYFINPSLVTFKRIQPPIFDAANLPTCADLGLGGNCVVATGPGISGSGNGSIVSVATAELGNKGAYLQPKSTLSLLDRYGILRAALANNSGPQIDKYFSPGGTPGAPWCAYFASWVYGQAGIKTIGTYSGRGGSLTLNNYFKSNNGKAIAEGTVKYLSAASVNAGTETPLPGDMAFFDRGSEGDSNGHTAIVTGYDPTSKKITSIDGNLGQSDEVKRATRNINKECTGGSDTCKLIGIGRVTK